MLRRDAKVEIGTRPPTCKVLTQGKRLQLKIENMTHLLYFLQRKSTGFRLVLIDRYNFRLSCVRNIGKWKLESDSQGSGKPTMSQNKGERKLCSSAIQGHHVIHFPLLPILEKGLDVCIF